MGFALRLMGSLPALQTRASGVGAWFERGPGRGSVQGSFVHGLERLSA